MEMVNMCTSVYSAQKVNKIYVATFLLSLFASVTRDMFFLYLFQKKTRTAIWSAVFVCE